MSEDYIHEKMNKFVYTCKYIIYWNVLLLYQATKLKANFNVGVIYKYIWQISLVLEISIPCGIAII